MKRIYLHLLAVAAIALLSLLLIPSPVYSRVAAIAGICLYLWISEAVPPFVPTLLLWALVPLFLSPIDTSYGLGNLLGWATDPVIVLFFGGFTLGVATEAFGFDRRLTRTALKWAGGSFAMFLLIAMMVTAFLSMWISNIAAAALVLASLRPTLSMLDDDSILRRVTLLGVALGADLGGIATPIGTGPNAIAISTVSNVQPVSFVGWMTFGLPLAMGMVLFAFAMLFMRARPAISGWPECSVSVDGRETEPLRLWSRETAFIFVLTGTAALWLAEPMHGVPASVVALAAAALLFLTGMLKKEHLYRIDWSTLLLIAGGITLGRLLEHSGMIRELSTAIPFSEMNVTVSLFVLCFASALLSALMSNTATAVLLIPLAMALIPAPSTAIIIAVAASFGVPFIVSTPPNAMAFGEGGLGFGDLFKPGIVLMLVGCLLVSLTGRAVLNFAGIP